MKIENFCSNTSDVIFNILDYVQYFDDQFVEGLSSDEIHDYKKAQFLSGSLDIRVAKATPRSSDPTSTRITEIDLELPRNGKITILNICLKELMLCLVKK